MKNTRFLSIIVTFCFVISLVIPLLTMDVFAKDTILKKQSDIVYRTSQFVTKNNPNGHEITFINTIEAYKNGCIHIELYSHNAQNSQVDIGNIVFNDIFIKDFDINSNIIDSPYTTTTTGTTTARTGKVYFETSSDTNTDISTNANNIDKCNNSTINRLENCKLSRFFQEDSVVYNLYSYHAYSTNFNIDLYVKQNYIDSTVTLTIFDKECEIDFGNYKIDPIKKLENDLVCYKSVDADLDGMVTPYDIQLLLLYYTSSLTGEVSGKFEDYSNYINFHPNT